VPRWACRPKYGKSKNQSRNRENLVIRKGKALIMFTQDPLQSYQTTGAYSGGQTPYGVPATAFHSPFNPLAFHPQAAVAQQLLNPVAQQFLNPTAGGYGMVPLSVIPQWQGGFGPQPTPFQNPAIFYSLLQGHNPYIAALQQNPLLAAGIQNPSFAASMQNPLIAGQYPLLQHHLTQAHLQNPILAAGLQNPLQNPMINPLQSFFAAQQQPQFGYPLAPQSLLGAAGIGQSFGQFHPLAQGAFRPGVGFGASPFAGCF
jgi:hypothetical protein